MKKYLIWLTFIIFVSKITAQENAVTGGIYVSPVISWLKPDVKTIEKDKSKFGFGFGLTVDLNLSKNFAFSTGLSFVNLGGSIQYSDSIPEFKAVDTTYSLKGGSIINYKTQFIELPFSIKGKTNEIGYITYFLKAGISPNFRFKAKGDVTVNSGDDIKAEVRGFNMGFIIGGGIEYSLGGSTKLLVEALFNNGLTDFTKTKTWDDRNNKLRTSSDKVIINNISLRVGILF